MISFIYYMMFIVTISKIYKYQLKWTLFFKYIKSGLILTTILVWNRKFKQVSSVIFCSIIIYTTLLNRYND